MSTSIPTYIPALADRGYDWAWSGLDGFFLDDDLTVINLECSPSEMGVAEDKAFTFQCPDGMPEMVAAGVEVTNLGNNHSQDFGKEAMLDGRQRLLDSGSATGGGRGRCDRSIRLCPLRTEWMEGGGGWIRRGSAARWMDCHGGCGRDG